MTVNNSPECESFKQGEEQYCPETVFTYGYLEESSPTGISQRGYSTNLVVGEHVAAHIPDKTSRVHPWTNKGIILRQQL